MFQNERENNEANVCMSILCSLYNLMERCQATCSKEEIAKLLSFTDTQGTSIFEASNTDNLRLVPTQEERKQFEQ